MHDLRRRTRSRTLLFLVSALLVGPLAACGDGGTGPVPEITRLPRELSVSEEQIIRASNRFGFDLAHRVDDPDSGFFLSPLSASMALGMALNGAAGTTWDQMRSVLGFGDLAQDDVNGSYRSLIDLLLGLDPHVRMAIGNSVWYDSTRMRVRDSFVQAVSDPFDAEVAGLDFADPAAPQRINGWVSDATEGRIPRIVPDPIPDAIAMYLINAIYFEGDWTTQFDPDRTADGDFHLEDGSTVRVPMMQREEAELGMYQDSAVLAAELPYGGKAFVMTILLPAPGTGVDALLASLDAERWGRIVDAISTREAAVVLPRFQTTWERVLDDDLKALGMTDAFDPDRADFSALSPDPRVAIQEVRQKSFVRVDEEGTEAAAATSVGVGLTSAPPTIRVDRPFLFAIRERLSGTILFLGKVLRPEDAGG